MLLASKAALAGIVFVLMTTGISRPPPTPLAPEPNFREQMPAVGHESEIKKMQESLRDKGLYQSQVDGVFGLRSRASIRAYQKAENLPVTGELDTQTAGKLGVRREDRQETGYETTQGKPSAGVKWAKASGRTYKTAGKTVRTGAAAESGRERPDKTLQAESDKRPE
jgi:peptidoglycan hydrolase-like protein with peptidoglycan-binding domain